MNEGATVVLGVGNIVHADDGAGVHALRLLREDARVPAPARFVEGGTLGLELITYTSGAARLLVLDAVDTGQAPGTIVRLSGDDWRRAPGGSNVHQLGLSDLMNALRLIDGEPGEVVLLGIQPQSTDWSASLTSEVEAALPRLVNAAVEQLKSWNNPNPARESTTECITA